MGESLESSEALPLDLANAEGFCAPLFIDTMPIFELRVRDVSYSPFYNSVEPYLLTCSYLT